MLDVPQEWEIRDELQRLVLADLHGPLGGDDEEFSGENPIDRYPLGRLAPRGVVLEPDTHDDLAAADAGDASEVDPEPSAPNVPSLAGCDLVKDYWSGRPPILTSPTSWCVAGPASTTGVAVHADIDDDNPLRAKEIHTRTVPDYEIPATDVPSVGTDPDLPGLADLELDMKRLAELAETSADALVTALRPLVAGYRAQDRGHRPAARISGRLRRPGPRQP